MLQVIEGQGDPLSTFWRERGVKQPCLGCDRPTTGRYKIHGQSGVMVACARCAVAGWSEREWLQVVAS